MECKNTGAVYEVRTYGSVRGMRQKPHPTRFILRYLTEPIKKQKRDL